MQYNMVIGRTKASTSGFKDDSNYVSGHNWGVHLVALNEGPDFRQRGTYGEYRPRLHRYISIHVVLKTRSCAFNLRSN